MADEHPTVVVQQSPSQPQGHAPVVVATGVIDALKSSPTLLVIVILNCVMIVAAAYYLLQLEKYRHLERLELFKLIEHRGLGDGYDSGPRPRPSGLARHRTDWAIVPRAAKSAVDGP